MASRDRTTTGTVDPATWVDLHGDTLYRYALSRLRNPDTAEEVVQETFVAGLHSLAQYSGRGAEGAWLLGILKRKIVDCVRQRNRPDSATGTETSADASETFFDDKGNWRFDPRVAKMRPDACLEREEFWETFRGCLKSLPLQQADAFSLRKMEELSSDDICKEMQITASNLWVLLHRARLRLMRCMKLHLEGREDL